MDYEAIYQFLTLPRKPSIDIAALRAHLKDQQRQDAERVLLWHDNRVPPYFGMEGGKPLAGKWAEFRRERERRNVQRMEMPADDGPFFGAPFPGELLEQIKRRSPENPQLVHADALAELRSVGSVVSRALFDTLLHQWETGNYWKAPQWKSAYYPDGMALIGLSEESEYLRAYLRIMALSRCSSIQTSAAQYTSQLRFVRYNRHEAWKMKKSQEAIRDTALRELAWQYLYEWQESGWLPPIEGILLARI
jgi:hypothetical protein